MSIESISGFKASGGKHKSHNGNISARNARRLAKKKKPVKMNGGNRGLNQHLGE